MTKNHGGIILFMLTIVGVLQSDARMSAGDIDDAGRHSMQSIEDVDRGNCCDETRWWVTAPNRSGTSSQRLSGLAEGSCLELRDRAGRTALHHATIQGSCRLVRLLLAAGADIDAQDDSGRTALDLATSLGLWRIAATLVDAGADAESTDLLASQQFHTTTAERCQTAKRTFVASGVVSNG